MEKLNYFIKDGDKYILKKQSTRAIIFTTIFGAFSIFCFIIDETLLLGFLTLPFALVFPLRLTSSTVFDTSKKALVFKRSLIAKEKEYPFDCFDQFVLTKMRTNGIATNTNLVMEFIINGKTRQIPLREGGPRTKKSHSLADEIEWIMQQQN